ncbi:MAG TPA: diaminopimelate decarboxylase [Elusimicrobiota bacterium]|jgi:diaminopimelate decarboxylase|nr:diaminopimelate decarboxylase [Elusimicrobiota bacterium]
MHPSLLERLAREHGTPLYVYDAARVRDNFRRFDAAFAGVPHLVCYALKANSNRALCRVLSAEGAGADVVSGGELLRALAAGFAPAKTVFSGVGKTDPELELGLRRGLGAFHVESEGELERLAAAARRLGRPARFAVRVNPDVDAGTHAHITTGTAENKFGVPEERARALYRRARSSRFLRAVGVQAHIGSQIARPGPYRRSLAALLRLADELAAAGAPLEYVDAGGGMGIAYAPGEGSLDAAELARELVGPIAARGLRLLLEPGRFLVGDAGELLTRVVEVKRGPRRDFVIVDAAMNDLARPALYEAYHEVVPLRPRRGTRRPCDVVGPICESADFLAKGRRLPPARRGDLLAVRSAGAYGFSMSSQYNSRPRAAEVLVDGARARLVRRRETPADLTRHER